MRYIVDTNVCNWLVDGRVDLSSLFSDEELAATHIQIDEINRTKDTERRAQLFLRFTKIAPAIPPKENGIWEASRWVESKWSNGERLNSIITALDNRRRKPNNRENALIAEMAMANN